MNFAKRVELVDLERMSNLILVALYDHYTNSDQEFVGIDNIGAVVGCSGINALSDLMQDLEDNDLVFREVVRTSEPATIAAITGVGYVQRKTKNFRLTRNGAILVGSMRPEQFQLLASELLVDSAQAAPSSQIGDEWEPLKIDRDAPRFQEVVKVTEESIERIAADNGFAASRTEERDGIVETMRGALKALRSGWVSRASIIASLVKPLKYLSEKFSGSAIGEAGKRAADALMSLLGL